MKNSLFGKLLIVILAIVLLAPMAANIAGKNEFSDGVQGTDIEEPSGLTPAIRDEIVSELSLRITDQLEVAKLSGDFDGEDGKSAYAYAQDGGYDGTETEFAEDINPDNINANANSFIATELAKRGQLKPEFANSVEECTDTTKLYVLPDGYIYAYMLTEKEVGGYKNLLPEAVGTDKTTPYNGTGYKDGARLSSSGAESTLTGAFLTGFVPVKVGETLYFNGQYIKPDWSYASSANARFYDADFNSIGSSSMPMSQYADEGNHFSDVVIDADNYVTQFTLNTDWTYFPNWSDVAYIRMTLIGSGEGCVISKTPIVESTIEKVYAWASTGHAFVPADYEERILDLEEQMQETSEDVATSTQSIIGLGERVADLEAGNSFSVPEYWSLVIQVAKEKVEEKQDLGGVNSVSFLWASDIHASAGIDERGQRFGMVAKAIMDEADIPLFVGTGDFMSQSSHANVTDVYNELALARKWLDPIPYDRQALIMGNHDGAWGDTTSGYYNKQLPLEEMYNLIYRKQAMDFRRVSGDNGTYYYIDNLSQKVRFIMLNTNNTPSAEDYDNDDGTAIYDRFHLSCYCQAQYDWLTDVALDMPEGYTAFIFAHEPYSGDYSLMTGVVDAFNNKGTYKNSFTDSDNAWRNASVDVNFANANGEIAAVFAGHTHLSEIRSEDNNPMYSTCPLIMITNAVGGEVRDGTTRTDGTTTEFAMDIVTVDLKNRNIYMTRLGAGEDREISY